MSRLFGGVIQNGYVVRDIEAAMRHWIDVLGVGPWFYIEHLPVSDFRPRSGDRPLGFLCPPKYERLNPNQG
jgi:hypothetical protein